MNTFRKGLYYCAALLCILTIVYIPLAIIIKQNIDIQESIDNKK